MEFGYCIVYVANVPEALAFWERAFGLERKFLAEEGVFGALHTGSTTLAFCSHALARDSVGQDYVRADKSREPLGMEVGLVTKDVPAALKRAVDAGATLLSPAQQKPWGQTVAYVRCPEGTLVELCSPMT
jgi:uncharacterized glyoxalase superfamily protein PhnB